MISQFLVCPFDEQLLSALSGRSVVVRIDDIRELSRVEEVLERNRSHLHCLVIESDASVVSLRYQESWSHIPIALFSPELGRFRDLAGQLGVLRKLNLRVYLPSDRAASFASLRVLSSLGIESALVFSKEGLDWERVADLMTYALLGQRPRAGIAPFNYVASRYQHERRTDFGAVYFDDPHTYLHVGAGGCVALSDADLKAGVYLAESVEELNNIENHQKFRAHEGRWREFFLKTDGCAYCPGWRICLGKHADTVERDPGCREFFAEFLDSVEQHQSLTSKGKLVWQP